MSHGKMTLAHRLFTVAKDEETPETFDTSRNKLATKLPDFDIMRQHSRPRDRSHAVATLTLETQRASIPCAPYYHLLNTQAAKWILH